MSQQPSKRLFLLRHGRTEWNHTRRAQGQADVPLDEVGHAQAQAAAPRLALVGAVAAVVLRPRPGPPDRRPRRRRDRAEGRGGPAAAGVLRRRARGHDVGRGGRASSRRWPTASRSASGWPASPGAETDDDVRARIVPAVEDCLAALAWGETGIAVSHGAALKLALGGLLGWDEQAVRSLGVLDNCHWATVAGAGGGPAAAAARLRGGRFRIRDHHWLRFPGCLGPGGRPPGTKRRGCGAAGSAPPWHGGGQGFESPQLHRTQRRAVLTDRPSSVFARPFEPTWFEPTPGAGSRVTRTYWDESDPVDRWGTSVLRRILLPACVAVFSGALVAVPAAQGATDGLQKRPGLGPPGAGDQRHGRLELQHHRRRHQPEQPERHQQRGSPAGGQAGHQRHRQRRPSRRHRAAGGLPVAGPRT